MNIRSGIHHNQLTTDETGQTMAEYGVVLGVIVLGVILAIGVLALAISGRLENIGTTIGGIA